VALFDACVVGEDDDRLRLVEAGEVEDVAVLPELVLDVVVAERGRRGDEDGAGAGSERGEQAVTTGGERGHGASLQGYDICPQAEDCPSAEAGGKPPPSTRPRQGVCSSYPMRDRSGRRRKIEVVSEEEAQQTFV